MSLNRDQERTVAVRLRMLEEALAEIRDLMDADEEGILYRRDRPRFTDEQRAAVLALVAELRAAIRAVAETFHLPREDQDARQHMLGLLAIAWESLCEIDSRRLAAYGEVDPALAVTLDPAIGRLIELVVALQRSAERAGRSSDRTDGSDVT
jgi:hypothetical protein